MQPNVVAYHYLVGYYLNAPTIGGGSIDKAEETARTSAEFDPERSERLIGQIAARREGRTAGGNGR